MRRTFSKRAESRKEKETRRESESLLNTQRHSSSFKCMHVICSGLAEGCQGGKIPGLLHLKVNRQNCQPRSADKFKILEQGRQPLSLNSASSHLLEKKIIQTNVGVFSERTDVLIQSCKES